jgi:glycosyltransferase involved in cell wall biosynthesis
MNILFALPGLHKYSRGAEVAFVSIAKELAAVGHSITLIGSGHAKADMPYRFLHAGSAAREKFERFPHMPGFRSDTAYEELTFLPALLRCYRPSEYDVTLTCSYPFTNLALRHPVRAGRRPYHVFVTENGDWPAYSQNSEYRYFDCNGLVCTNPEFYERNKGKWRARLIPNGVDCDRFQPGHAHRQEFSLPMDGFLVLMVSALVPNKRVEKGIEAVSRIPSAHLCVAGDGPLRNAIDECAARLLPGRFTRLTTPAEKMPQLYRSADVFLHLCKDESFGNVYLEALATGLPVIAHDSAHTRWILGDDEYLVDSDDAAEIALHIERAHKAPVSMRMQRVAKAAAFSWKKIGGMYAQFLEEIVKS